MIGRRTLNPTFSLTFPLSLHNCSDIFIENVFVIARILWVVKKKMTKNIFLYKIERLKLKVMHQAAGS